MESNVCSTLSVIGLRLQVPQAIFRSCKFLNTTPSLLQGRSQPPPDKNFGSFPSDFAINLYNELRFSRQHDNILFSPLSVATVLSMLLNGARGNTAKELETVLHVSGPSVKNLFSKLLSELHSYEPNATICTANRLFAEKSFPISREYIYTLKAFYKSGIQSVDFRKQAEKSRVLINKWVSKETHAKIQNLIQKGEVTRNTKLTLVNALYFKGRLSDPFSARFTMKETFFGTKGKTMVNMMSGYATVGRAYDKDLDVEVVAVPYAGDKLSMIIVLPKKKDGIFDLDITLTPSKFTGLLKQLQDELVVLALPKFKLSMPVELSKVLKVLGLEQVFSESADLSGITKARGFSLGSVIHEAFMEVKEEETEAVAARSELIAGSALRELDGVIVDHPFLFAIQSRNHDSPLLLGSIRNLEG